MSIRKREQMTDQDWDELDAAVESKLPGHRVVRRSPGPAAGADAAERGAMAPDAGTPDLDVLRAKYLRRSGATTAAATRGSTPQADEAGPPDQEGDDAIIAVEPVEASPRDAARRTKTVVVSRDGDIVGAQG